MSTTKSSTKSGTKSSSKSKGAPKQIDPHKLLMTDNEFINRTLINAPAIDGIKKLNRFGIPETYSNDLGGTKEFLFITRPDLNIFDSSGKLFPGMLRNGFIEDLWNDSNGFGRTILKSLQQANSNYKCPFIATAFDKVRDYSPIDDELESIEVGDTIHGHKVVYGKHNYRSRSAGTLSIRFEDDKYLSLYNTIKAWNDYIEAVSFGLHEPNRKYIMGNNGLILDYAVSIYYIVTRLDMEEILYWEKVCGVFPILIPNSIFNYQRGGQRVLEYTINFRYAMRDKPMNPVALGEFNKLSSWIKDGKYLPNWDAKNRTHGEPMVTTAFITKKDKKYFLRWRGDK